MNAEVIESPGERFVYMVASHSKEGRRYRVDLTANKGGMKCACSDHMMRKQPMIDCGAPLLTPQTMCKHTKAALRYFNLQILPKLERTQ